MENLIVKATRRQRFDFDLFFSYLLQYKSEFGNCLVPQNYVINGYKLGQRISNIRRGTIKLSETQRLKLNEIGFAWNATIRFNFDKLYKYLVEYKNKFGNCSVPQNYVINGYKLGQKISNIRNGNIKLSETQRLKLDRIGFVWDTKTYNFDKFYKYLIEYKTKFGNCLVSINYIINGYKLGKRISNIRSGAIKLSETQRLKLDKIGFVWNNRFYFDFDKFYKYIVEYKTKFDNCLVPQNYAINGYKLGKRISSIRSGDIKLSEKQKLKLNEIGFVWDATYYFNFDKFYKYLIEYKTKFGNLLVPQNYIINGYKLGQKVVSIRTGKTITNKEQRAKLDDIGFVWNTRFIDKTRKFNFNEFYKYLSKYGDKFSNANVPYDYIIDNYELGYYVRQIRTKRIKLNEEQIGKLKELDFVFDTHNQFYSNVIYSIDDNSNYLAQHMLNGDMLARVMLYKKFIPAIYFYSNKMPNKTLRDDAISYLSECLLSILDRINITDKTDSFINKSMKGYYLLFLRKYCKNKEISIYAPKPGTDDITIESNLKSDENDNPDVIVNSKVFNEQLIETLKECLTKSEFRLITYYFGINCEKKTIEELAEKYNVPKIKVKKAIARIVKSLKTKLNESEWNDSY